MRYAIAVLAALLVALPVWGQQPAQRPQESTIFHYTELPERGNPKTSMLESGQQAGGGGVLSQSPKGGTGTVISDYDKLKLPPCAFGLSRVEVLASPTKPTPSLNTYSPAGGMFTVGVPIKTRWACPMERAIALYGDERVRYVPSMLDGGKYCEGADSGRCVNELEAIYTYKLSSARVEVCDEDGKTNCVEVYREPVKP